MAIQTLSDLTSAVGAWLFARTDLTAVIPNFISLFEAEANRTLFVRQMEARAVATIDPTSPTPDFLPLPGDFQTMRRVRLLNAVTGIKSLRYMTGTQMDDRRDQSNNGTGEPEFFSLYGSVIEFFPQPVQNYQLEMVYRTNLQSLGSVISGQTITTNWLLTMAPDAYLFGTLMQAAPYLSDDERIPVWMGGMQKAIKQLNDLSEEALYNAGPLVQRSRRRGY